MAPVIVPSDAHHPAVLHSSPPYTVECGPAASPNETPIRRSVLANKPGTPLKMKPRDDISTTWELINFIAKRYGDKPCLGSRKLIKLHEETKLVKKIVDGKETSVPKKWNYYEMSPYTYISYKELLEQVTVFGSGLKSIGVTLLEMYASTSANWITLAQAAASQSIPIATAYDTLGEEGLTHSLVETEANAIFIDGVLLKSLIRPLAKATLVTTVIYRDSLADVDLAAFKEAHPSVTLLSVDELYEKGKEAEIAPNPLQPEDVSCIMYTSGSTGTPKGVVILQKNIIAAVSGIDGAIEGAVNEYDYLLTYLPLAHILEFVFELGCLYWGGTLGYGTVKTISDASMRNCRGDIAEFRPTVMVGVPAVWESVRKGIIAKVHAAGKVKSGMFWGAYHAKGFLQHWRIPGSGVLDAAVFKKVKEATGGRLRLVMNGGASISRDTQGFIQSVIAPMVLGYGMTETCAMGFLMSPHQVTLGTIGAPVTSVEIKLIDVPENGYLAKNNPPQGEVLIRGGPVTPRYFKNEEETKASRTDDGWFLTGDIGEWTPEGHLRLIDRKKNLVKTLNGEYIALEKLESIYRTSNIVANICVYADPDHVKPIAIVVPAEPALIKLAKEKGITGKEFGHLVHDSVVERAVLASLLDSGRKGGLAGIELICGVVLVDEEWTAQNGFLTAAQKLQRRKIVDANHKHIHKVYKESE
ncbi:eukaryotic long-chain fatty acid CoA synthetase (LC-FACS) [Lipomyces oligophaga]|uniref:eukaryotic long-chain fatty acid CoA synthetase (LC-FACS) n=1 Tax=Lipomyces oligophaga TaxID=45792 RepID=UPI0034CD0270